MATGPGRILEPGQLLRASVLETISANEVRLGLLGFELIAKTQAPLQAGTELTLLVDRSGSTVLLRPLDAQLLLQGNPDSGVASLGALPAALEKLRGLLPRADVQRLLPQLRIPAALQSRFAGEAPLDAEGMRSFHDWLGRGFERKLAAWVREGAPAGADRTELLASLRSMPDSLPIDAKGSEQPPVDPQVREALTSLAKSSDAWRGEQAQRAESGAPLVFPLPVMEGSFLREGRMFLLREVADNGGDDTEGGEGGGGESRPFTLVFLLELESMGALRVDAQMSGRDVVLGFVCALEQAALRIHRDLSELGKEFEKKQLRLVRSSVRVQRDGTLPVLDLLPPPPPGSSRLDLQL